MLMIITCKRALPTANDSVRNIDLIVVGKK